MGCPVAGAHPEPVKLPADVSKKLREAQVIITQRLREAKSGIERDWGLGYLETTIWALGMEAEMAFTAKNAVSTDNMDMAEVTDYLNHFLEKYGFQSLKGAGSDTASGSPA